MKIFTQNFLKSIYIALFGALVASCSLNSDEVENRGYMTKFSDFSKIKAGSSTKSDVIQALGSPSTTSMFGEETWFYVGKEQTKETFFEPEIKTYDGYEITFNKSGVVSSVNKKDKSALKEFEVAQDSTQTSGQELTVWQQLLGNLGKFAPGQKNGGPKTGCNARWAETKVLI